jgi:transposase
MKQVEDYETIRRAYFVEKKSIRAIHRELGYDRDTIRKAIVNPSPKPYTLNQPRAAPVLGPYKQRITELLDESDRQRRKQRYTAHRIFELLKAEGYPGSEGAVQNYVGQQRRHRKKRTAYLPLEFEPGQNGQVDWGEAEAEIGGERMMVQLFIMRLNFAKVRFAMAFPFQKQEAFLEGHIQAFHFFGGVPYEIAYDNLKTAVFQVLEGRNRQEQQAFTGFRSHYLFGSRYCAPGQGHEKGGVENDVGYVQRNFMAPILRAESYVELNAKLLAACYQDVERHIRGREKSVAELWADEKSHLLPLPATDYLACTRFPCTPNGYSQVELDTNRYSVPVTERNSQLVLRAYPFRVEIVQGDKVIAEHLRCFGRQQDVLNPLHYLALLEQRPGALDHAKPIRQWRKEWPADYERLLEELRQRWPDGRGVREFITILRLHEKHPAPLVTQAIRQAIELGAAHLDGVQLCLHQLQFPEKQSPTLEATLCPQLAQVGTQPIDLEQYDRLLVRS